MSSVPSAVLNDTTECDNELTIKKIDVSGEEELFREAMFKNDFSIILNVDLRCTVCGQDINWLLLLKKQIMIHPVLDVLMCEGCLVSVTTSNSNSSCLWCGSKPSASKIHKCKNCFMKFCSSCVRLNFGLSMYGWMQFCGNSWICFLCENSSSECTESFWILRALCDAAQKMCNEMKKLDERNPATTIVTECVICTNNLETVFVLKCKHKFHKACIDEWMKKNRSCPICRSSYVGVNTP